MKSIVSFSPLIIWHFSCQILLKHQRVSQRGDEEIVGVDLWYLYFVIKTQIREFHFSTYNETKFHFGFSKSCFWTKEDVLSSETYSIPLDFFSTFYISQDQFTTCLSKLLEYNMLLRNPCTIIKIGSFVSDFLMSLYAVNTNK